MKVILPGYEGTKKVLTANSYFISKYFPGFDTYFLNYGSFDGKLYCGQYISLDNEQIGGKKAWAKYTIEYLEKLDDEFIIFADGDFFITHSYNQLEYRNLLEDMKTCLVGYMSSEEDNKRFSRTAQYAMWKREFLLEVLKSKEEGGISSIWRFESRGARYINKLDEKSKIVAWRPVMRYDPHSSIAYRRNPGMVAVGEAMREDVEFLISQGYLNRDELVLAHPRRGHKMIMYT